ncbi:MAG: nitrilase-related carbon-nitrogen hydrolase [candidate division Zixibacteria bacterium]|nr:nitrilase-related carbon-nitrogen hydrolase [candidate division Zixibacteria bacterium]
MKIGFVQFCPIFGKKEENLEKVEKLIQKEEADLLVLPELFNTGYIFADKEELESLAEKIPEGETSRFLLELSRRRKMSLVFGIAEKAKNKLYNSAVLLTPEGVKGVYRKLHLFDQEKYLFDPGENEPEVFDDGKARIGMMVCFDWLFPEVARVLALKGAEIICHPSDLILPYAQEAMITRSLENGVFTITCNRTGEEDRVGRKLSFTGRSQITDPKGNMLLQASQDKEEVGVVEIDPLLARDKKFTENNFIFDDRRPEFYKRLLTK